MGTYRAYYDESIEETFKADSDEDAIRAAETIGDLNEYPIVWEVCELDANFNDKRCIY